MPHATSFAAASGVGASARPENANAARSNPRRPRVLVKASKWKVPLLLSLLVWALIVPAQVLSGIVVGRYLLGIYEAIPLIAAAVTIWLVLQSVRRSWQHR
jgi:hypothetical protein